jgi:iron-sulfur cluster assembly protein
MITITDNAVKKIKELQDRKGAQLKSLRLGLKGGGCSGFSYSMDFTDKIEDNDRHLDFSGLRVVVDPKSYLFLNGTTLDYVDDIVDAGFKFQNPNSTGSCGCGKSVSF